jgi:hypothetical protein
MRGRKRANIVLGLDGHRRPQRFREGCKPASGQEDLHVIFGFN